MSWFFGEQVQEKLVAVLDGYKTNRINKVKDRLQIEVETYHPSFGCTNFLEPQDACDLIRLSKNSDLLSNDSEYLEVRKRVYDKFSFLGSISSDESSLYIPGHSRPEVLNEYRDELVGALGLIEQHCSWMKVLFDKTIVEVCPVVSDKQPRKGWAMSDYRLIGTIFLNLQKKPYPIIRQAISLAHELSHNILMIYQSGSNPIPEKYAFSSVYSGIRKVKRPILMSLHAAYALGYMIEVGQCFVESDDFQDDEVTYIEKTVADYKRDLRQALLESDDRKLTTIGEILLSELKDLSS